MQVQALTNTTPTFDGLRSFAVVFDAGEDPVSGLERVARDEGIDSAQLTAIGGFREATIGWFDLDSRDYRRIDVREQVELLSLVGDVTLASQLGEERRIHAHVVLGRSTGATVGGHLLEARVRPTLEVIVTEAPRTLRRRHDPETGLSLIDLEPAAVAPGPSVT